MVCSQPTAQPRRTKWVSCGQSNSRTGWGSHINAPCEPLDANFQPCGQGLTGWIAPGLTCTALGGGLCCGKRSSGWAAWAAPAASSSAPVNAEKYRDFLFMVTLLPGLSGHPPWVALCMGRGWRPFGSSCAATPTCIRVPTARPPAASPRACGGGESCAPKCPAGPRPPFANPPGADRRHPAGRTGLPSSLSLAMVHAGARWTLEGHRPPH